MRKLHTMFRSLEEATNQYHALQRTCDNMRDMLEEKDVIIDEQKAEISRLRFQLRKAQEGQSNVGMVELLHRRNEALDSRVFGLEASTSAPDTSRDHAIALQLYCEMNDATEVMPAPSAMLPAAKKESCADMFAAVALSEARKRQQENLDKTKRERKFQPIGAAHLPAVRGARPSSFGEPRPSLFDDARPFTQPDVLLGSFAGLHLAERWARDQPEEGNDY